MKKQLKAIEKQANTTNVCIALDWLALYFKGEHLFKQGIEEGDEIYLTDDCFLVAIHKPTLHFNDHFLIMYKKEVCGHVLTGSKNEKFFKKETIKVEFANHTLYSGEWQEILQTLENAGLQYTGASRIDIAIDGVGYLQELMNLYTKQTLENKHTRLKNSSTMRARFSAKVHNPKTMNFENFNIGTAGGQKMITIYNKTLEISKSGKDYIQDFWMKNGVIAEKADLARMKAYIDKHEKRDDEVVRLDGVENIYRFEIRLKSASVKEIQGFDLNMLKSSKGLASIVKLHCKNYFEMQYNDDSNISRCTPFLLLPFQRLEAQYLQKIERVEKGGEYKAKMTIHGIVQDIHKGAVKNENINEAIEVIIDRAYRYSLSGYLAKKLDEWETKYYALISKERRAEVLQILGQIRSRNKELMVEYLELAARNNQADATGFFGE